MVETLSSMSEPAPEPRVLELAQGGVSLLLDTTGPGVPRALYWGAHLAPYSGDGAAYWQADRAAGLLAGLADGLDTAGSLMPTQLSGWFGRPLLAGHREGEHHPVRFTRSGPITAGPPANSPAGPGSAVAFEAVDELAGLRLRTEIEMTAPGVLRMRHTLVNTEQSSYTLDRLSCALPLPAQAAEILDFTGGWAKERSPQRAPLRDGVWVRENRRGRTGFDAGLLVVGTPGFGFGQGQVWAVHAAWSGNHVHYVEAQPDGQVVLAAGELLEPGEIRLGPDQAYQSPWVYLAHADEGLDGLSRRLHASLRARPAHPGSPRPLTLNTWEAVYFRHDEDTMLHLADVAAKTGVERFVVDDGWFLGRRSDNAGLGDWYVDPAVWPNGLHRIARHVKDLGMQFGLWFEPEMANPDSDLLREHPDWLLADPRRLPREQRNQHVLDLARPEVYAYLLERIGSLVAEYAIDYIKWDHNRDVAAPVHEGVPGVHAHTLAVYRLMDELRSRHPGLEIESCSSGGARADLGVLEHTDRVWGSDNIDPLSRQRIQRWTGLMLPPELIGSHVGTSPAHTTGRASRLSLRCATALFCHAGIEADLSGWALADLERMASWAVLYKELRGLLHGGDVVRVDHPDPAAWVHGVVSPARDRAVFAYVQLDASTGDRTAPIRLPGLDPEREYVLEALPAASAPEASWPRWAAAPEPVPLTGVALGRIGVPAPALANTPGEAFVFTATAVAGS
ncbi:alpha-galactosidase [Actinospica durhamensis]|uniref:Alpha-galactosidase n=1 Tax=Actinospica durhamensis TaxID=1508375 RepID=A0A941EX73_9ACTN|nr:alpha-galactosidase [Actinospica durhamensis]MBR7838053.1 alpha-galactosidase [Actinospica durhamensis]